MPNSLGNESLHDRRDRALLLCGFATALRVSETVWLQVADIEPREKGNVVSIGFFKGDQAGQGQKVAAIALPGSPYCPVAALRASLVAARADQGALFQRISGVGAVGDLTMSNRTVVRLIKPHGQSGRTRSHGDLACDDGPVRRGAEIHNEGLHDESISFANDTKYPESDHALFVAELGLSPSYNNP